MKRFQQLKKKLRESQGVTLIETMMAMTFLSIGLMAVAQMIPAGMSGITQARVRSNAIQAAQQRMDTIRSSGYTSAEMAAGQYSETSGNYTITWTIADDNPVPGTKRVDMNASWATSKGTRISDLTTYVTR